jgi:hypothetical protein
MLHSGEAKRTVEYNQENRNTYISLLHLFSHPVEDIRHGIVMKNLNTEEKDTEDSTIENRIILLTTEVICETDIPGEQVYPIPKALDGIRFSALFSGILFDSRETTDTAGGPVLVLNLEALALAIKQDSLI